MTIRRQYYDNMYDADFFILKTNIAQGKLENCRYFVRSDLKTDEKFKKKNSIKSITMVLACHMQPEKLQCSLALILQLSENLWRGKALFFPKIFPHLVFWWKVLSNMSVHDLPSVFNWVEIW